MYFTLDLIYKYWKQKYLTLRMTGEKQNQLAPRPHTPASSSPSFIPAEFFDGKTSLKEHQESGEQ